MKSVSFCAAVALTFCMAGVVLGQSNVCVIDVATVFKNNGEFNQKLKALQTEAEQFKAYLQTKIGDLQSKAEQLKTMEVNSPQYTNLESQIAQENAQLTVEKNTKTREFVQREAQLHFETYVRTTNAVASLCNQRNVRLVLQFSSIPMDLGNPQTIIERVNSEIVYHSPQIDITQDIIAIMNQGSQRMGSAPTNNR